MAWGPWQILLVLILIVLLFGGKKLPEIARALGKAKGEFKKGTEEGEQLLREGKDNEPAKVEQKTTEEAK